jgi:phage-related holin
MKQIYLQILATAKWDALLGALSVFLGVVFNFITPVAGFIITSTALVFCDLITGIWAAKKQRQQVHSKGLRKTVAKITLYFMAIMLCHSVQTVYFNWLPLTYAIAVYIALTELLSNLENISIITGTNVFKEAKRTLRKFKLFNNEDLKQ